MKFDGNTWTTYDVLPTGDTLHEVGHLCIDRFNNVWFTSMSQWMGNYVDAFFRYDGTTFTKYSYWGPISGISADTLGNIWMVSSSGLTKFDGTNWMVFDSTNSPPGMMGLSEVMVDRQNNKWIMTYNPPNGNLYKFNDSTWTLMTVPFGRMSITDDDHVWLFTGSPNPLIEVNDTIISYHPAPLGLVWALKTDSLGHIWTGIQDFGPAVHRSRLHEYDGTSWIKHIISVTPLYHFNIPLIELGPDQSVWLYTSGSGVMRFKDSVWTSFTSVNSGLFSDMLWGLEIDGSGRLWVTSGLYSSSVMHTFDGNNWQAVPLPAGFAPKEIEADDLNNVWVSFSNDNGLGYYDGVSWTLYNTANSGLLDDYPYFLQVDGLGRIWMLSTNDLLQMYDGITWITYSSANAPFTTYIDNFYIDKALNIWVFSDSTYRFDGTTWTTINGNLPYIQSIAEDSSGNYWFGTSDGLFKYDGVQFTRFSPYPAPTPYWTGRMVIDSLNNIWAEGSGLTVFNENGIVIPTGVNNEIISAENFVIYPNPAEAFVDINPPTGELIREVSLINTLGQTVYHQTVNTTSTEGLRLKVSNLVSGVYMVSLVTDKGKRGAKFVKK